MGPLIWLVACGTDLSGSTLRHAPAASPPELATEGDSATSGGGLTDSAAGDTGGGDTGRGADTASASGEGCSWNMVGIEGFCIDVVEAGLDTWSPFEVPVGPQVAQALPGEIPQAYISGELAALACEAAGKRLCTSEEWLRACEGPAGWTWPYGDVYDPEACNVDREEHPIVSYWGEDPDRWDSAHMNDPGINQQPDTVDAAGSNPDCVSAEGVYDLHGNLHEWVADPEGSFRGGFYADAALNGEGCSYVTTAHSFAYHDYSTGFRCCANRLR